MTRQPSEITEERARRRRRRRLTVSEVADFLEYLAPPYLASPVSPSGIQVGSPSAPVRHIVIAAQPSFNALSAAAARKESLLLTASPLILHPFHSLRRDDPIGGKVAYLIEHRANFYALPNSFFSAPGGFDDSLAESLGLAPTSSILPTVFEPQYKLAVFTPEEAVDRVLRAASDAGAGRIGNYSHCSFRTAGTGTFLPREGAKPFLGKTGKMEEAPEYRLEMLVPERELQGVLAAILEAHPYEEVAYDVYAVKNPGIVYGRGRVGELPVSVSLSTVLDQVRDALSVSSIRCSNATDFPIFNLAVAAGYADGLVYPASRSLAGALVTGGASPEDLLLADGGIMVVIDIGYKASLAPGLRRLTAQLENTFAGDGVEVAYVE